MRSMPFSMPRRSTMKLASRNVSVHITDRHGFTVNVLNSVAYSSEV